MSAGAATNIHGTAISGGTSIVDVGAGPAQLLDVVPGREATGASGWLAARFCEERQRRPR